jgi:DNA-3-methyladenine glycosylase II
MTPIGAGSGTPPGYRPTRATTLPPVPEPVRIPVRGPFALAASARFLARTPPLGDPDAADDDVLRLAFALDGSGAPAGAALREREGAVACETAGDGPAGATAAQAARILSLDLDGADFEEVGERDPVIGRLQRAHAGLRPVLYPSPFEAGVWALLSQRTQMRQSMRIRERMAEGRRGRVEVGGRAMRPFPAPAALTDLETVEGLSLTRVEWLRELARAAVDGLLDAGELRRLPSEEALRVLRELPGVGAYSAELILVRGAGLPDLLPLSEPRLRRAVEVAYDLPGPPATPDLEAMAEAWRPFRAWVALLLRTELAARGG